MRERMLQGDNIEVIYSVVFLVLKGLSLVVPKGQVAALLGATAGEKINGRVREEIVRRGVFQVMEGRRVFEDLSVGENLRCGAHTRKDSANVKADYERVYAYFPRLKDRRKGLAGDVSGGGQQMLAIGRALMGRADVVLLDEPSLGLSPLLVKEIFGIIKDINEKEKTTILLVEQNARVALSISSYGYIMENGKVVLDGETDKLANNEDVKDHL